MSIIHQALKKVEGQKHGYSPAPSVLPKGVKEGLRLKWPVLGAGFAAFIVLLALSLFFYGLPARKAEESPKAGAPAVKTEPSPQTPSAERRNRDGAELYRLGKYQEALTELKEAVRLEPGNAAYHNNLGVALMSVDMAAEAEDSFKTALELKPGYPEALNNYGALLEKKGDAKRAIEAYRKAVSIDSRYPDAHLNLAIALEKAGDGEGALEGYEKYLKTAPEGRLKADVNSKVMALRSGLILKRAKGPR